MVCLFIDFLAIIQKNSFQFHKVLIDQLQVESFRNYLNPDQVNQKEYKIEQLDTTRTIPRKT